VSVVGRETRLRWAAVAAGVALLVTAVSQWPVAARLVADAIGNDGPSPTPRELLSRALRSGDIPHQGVAEARGSLGFPDLRDLGDAAGLLGHTTRSRVWWSSREAWRVDTVTATGEQDAYGLGGDVVLWDYERNLVTGIAGEPSIRLPRTDDLLPPQLVRRLAGGIGRNDQVIRLPRRSVAGELADGIRIVPGDPRSTVARFDIWMTRSGLPLQAEVVDHRGITAVASRYVDVSLSPPPRTVLVPPNAPGARRELTTEPDLVTRVALLDQWVMPTKLIGYGSSTSLVGAPTYGTGLARFVVIPLPYRITDRAIGDAFHAGAKLKRIAVGNNAALVALVPAGVLNAVIMRGSDATRTFVIVGSLTLDTLTQAAKGLLANPPAERA